MAVPSYVYVVVVAVALWFLPQKVDFDQCQRVCRVTHGKGMFDASISGSWRVFGDGQCSCSDASGKSLADVPRLYTSMPKGYPYINEAPNLKTSFIPTQANQQQEAADMKHLEEIKAMKLGSDSRVCGSDGKTHSDAAAAKAAGAKVLNCGACGACSNAKDIAKLREHATTISEVTGVCIIARMVLGTAFPFPLPPPYFSLGRWVDINCMTSRAGLSEHCAECWVEDHGCLITHCFQACVLSKATSHLPFASSPHEAYHGKNARGAYHNGGCVACMERRCSKPYVDSCGANRRTANIATDIQRDESEMCHSAEVVSA